MQDPEKFLRTQDIFPLIVHMVKASVDVGMGRGVDERAGIAIDFRIVTFAREDLGNLFHVGVPVDLSIFLCTINLRSRSPMMQ